MYKKIVRYFSKHVVFNSSVHIITGIGIGAILTHPVFDPHPLRIGIVLIAIGIAGHVIAYVNKN